MILPELAGGLAIATAIWITVEDYQKRSVPVLALGTLTLLLILEALTRQGLFYYLSELAPGLVFLVGFLVICWVLSRILFRRWPLGAADVWAILLLHLVTPLPDLLPLLISVLGLSLVLFFLFLSFKKKRQTIPLAGDISLGIALAVAAHLLGLINRFNLIS